MSTWYTNGVLQSEKHAIIYCRCLNSKTQEVMLVESVTRTSGHNGCIDHTLYPRADKDNKPRQVLMEKLP